MRAPCRRSCDRVRESHAFRRSIARATLFLIATLALVAPGVRAEITASSQLAGDRFGEAVAVTELSGGFRLIAVGAPSDPSIPTGARNVRIFIERDQNTFPVYLNEATLTSSSPDAATANFGAQLAMRTAADGSVLLAVGASSEATLRGAVHLFRRTTLGAWSQVQTLLAPERVPGDLFGESIAISEDLKLIAVGARNTRVDGVSGAGAVYAFKLAAGTYQFSATASSDILPTDFARVGDSVAIPTPPAGQKREILVGSTGAGQGVLHVLRENVPGTWARVRTIVPPVGTTGDGFGSALAASGQRAVIGMSDANASGNLGRGTAFALRRVQGVWSIDAELPFSGVIAQTANLGASAAMSGPTIVVGSERGESVHVFRRGTSGAWRQVERMTVPPAEGGTQATDAFGRSIALGGGLMVAGCPTANGVRGAINLFECDPTRLTAVRPDNSGRFGTACAINGTRAACSAIGETIFSSGADFFSGAIRVMNLVDGVWEHEADLPNPTEGSLVDFGLRLAMPTPDLIVATAPGDQSASITNRGRVYLYQRAAPGVWTRIHIDSPETNFTDFGEGLAAAMDGGVPLIAVGATSLVGPGRVHVLVGTQFVQVLENPSPANDDGFGQSLAMHRYANGAIDLWVGAPGAETAAGVDSGSISLFRRAAGASQFTLVQADFTPPGTQPGEQLGTSLSMRGSLLVVASPARAATAVAGPGMARVLTRAANGAWSVVSGSIRAAPGRECAVNVATNGVFVAAAVAGPGEVARVVRVVNGTLQFVRSFDRPGLFNGTNSSSVFTGIALSSGPSPVLFVTDSAQNNGDRRFAGAVYPFVQLSP